MLVVLARTRVAEFESLRRWTEEYWPVLDWDELESRIKSLNRRLLKTLASTIVPLALSPRTPALPDYFGQSCFLLANACYYAMAEGDDEQFGDLFPTVLPAFLTAQSRISAELEHTDVRTRFAYSSEPIADLIELSGYAEIYSDLNNKEFKAIMHETWDGFLSSIEDPSQRLQGVVDILKLRSSIFGIFPYQSLRTLWKMDLEHRLRQQSLLSREAFELGWTSHAQSHPSPLIRALVGQVNSLNVDPSDVFLATYVRGHPAGGDSFLTRDARFFVDQMELQQDEWSPTADEDYE